MNQEQIHNGFYEYEMAEYGDPVDPIAEENAAIKKRIRMHIQKLTREAGQAPRLLKVAIEAAEKARIEQEVEEMLANEQRSTMGQWA